ncbi:DUF4349 domain-containing protein [Nocardioides pyridinolyticus]
MLSRVAVLPAALLAVLLGLAACSGGDSDSEDSPASSDAGGSVAAGARADAFMAESDGNTVRGAAEQEKPVDVVERSVIRRGNVELRAADVGKAQFEVQQVVDRYAGQVTAEETTTDDDGEPAYTRMELRIPTESFAEAMDALKGAAEFESASTGEKDVTAKVIDTQTRLAAQRRSIARITVLFDRAESIRDIMRIESELSRRQADLESLERQAAYLRGQTSMSTITVSIDQIAAKSGQKDDTDDAGFVTGLKAGWHALTTFAAALATALGALLPWLVVLAIFGFPALLVWRRRRATSDPGRTPSAA